MSDTDNIIWGTRMDATDSDYPEVLYVTVEEMIDEAGDMTAILTAHEAEDGLDYVPVGAVVAVYVKSYVARVALGKQLISLDDDNRGNRLAPQGYGGMGYTRFNTFEDDRDGIGNQRLQ